MKLGILKEPGAEQRVVMLPSHIKKLVTSGNNLLVEKGAGESAFSSDKDYEEAGAKTVSRGDLLKEAEMILGIHLPKKEELDALKTSQVLVFTVDPFSNIETVKSLKEKGNTVFSMDIIPRITRAQDKDILSAMATVSGYRAVLEAAMHLPRFFPMFMTAAGTIRPAKVLVLGAGVAGLQAIATARRLGGRVEAFDVRSEVKEQVESLGAKFVEVEGAKEDKSAGGYAVEQSEEYKARQQELIQEHARSSHVVITTAQIPGRKAPILITKETVENMMPGSVIIDLAASTGGNCEVTQNGKTINHGNVTIVGQSDYPATMSIDASTMFGNNVVNFLKLLIDNEGKLTLDFEDEIIHESCVVHQKDIYNKNIKSIIENQ